MIIYFLYVKRNDNCHFGTGLFIHKGIRSGVKRVEFISGRILYIVSVGWCGIIVLNVHAPTEDQSDDMKDSF
jgi:hypothetical protein